jgi:hypothetical protein
MRMKVSIRQRVGFMQDCVTELSLDTITQTQPKTQTALTYPCTQGSPRACTHKAWGEWKQEGWKAWACATAPRKAGVSRSKEIYGTSLS